MLSLAEYNQSSLDQKYDEVFSKGKLLDTFMSENYKISLYSYNGFIIEVLYRLEIDTIKDLLGMSVMEAAEKYVSLKGRLDIN